MLILGVDPGTVHMGYGVIQDDPQGLRCLDWGVLAPHSSLPIHQRLYRLYQALLDVVERWQPGEVAVEEPFVTPTRGAKTALAVGQAQGVAILAAAAHGLEVYRYSPSQVKQAVTDYGASTKEQVQEMVRMLLGLKERPSSPDAADALAVAVCHARHQQARRLVVEGGKL